MIPLLHWPCCHLAFIALCPPLVSGTHSLLVHLLPSLKLSLPLIQGFFHWSLQCGRSLRIYPCLSSLLLFFSRRSHPACRCPHASLLPRYRLLQIFLRFTHSLWSSKCLNVQPLNTHLTWMCPVYTFTTKSSSFSPNNSFPLSSSWWGLPLSSICLFPYSGSFSHSFHSPSSTSHSINYLILLTGDSKAWRFKMQPLKSDCLGSNFSSAHYLG